MDRHIKPHPQRRIYRDTAEWKDIIARFDQSGQTREQFCADQGLGLSTFSRWRQRLRWEAAPAQEKSGDALFVELTQDAPASSTPLWDVELQLGAGVCLRLKRSGC